MRRELNPGLAAPGHYQGAGQRGASAAGRGAAGRRWLTGGDEPIAGPADDRDEPDQPRPAVLLPGSASRRASRVPASVVDRVACGDLASARHEWGPAALDTQIVARSLTPSRSPADSGGRVFSELPWNPGAFPRRWLPHGRARPHGPAPARPALPRLPAQHRNRPLRRKPARLRYRRARLSWRLRWVPAGLQQGRVRPGRGAHLDLVHARSVSTGAWGRRTGPCRSTYPAAASHGMASR